MKYAFRYLLLAVLVLSLPAFAQKDDDHDSDRMSGNQNEATQRLNEASADLNKLTSAGDNNIPQSILADAKCVAIVPKLIKGGFVVGAQHGRGVATCRTDKGWSAPAFFVITGGSFGAQIGVEGVDLVMLFMNKEGADKLLQAEWKIGADAGIAAGPFGRDASASTSWKLNAGILTYSRAKGVFAGATLNGANVRADMDSIKTFYGREYNFREILTGQVVPPPAARPFIADIRRNFHEANAAK
jgi:lipid-binding SYLF domain-containing protein